MTPPQTKIRVTSKSPVGDTSIVTLIKTDTTLDHNQKAGKVWIVVLTSCGCAHCCAQVACLRFAFGGVAFARLRAPLRQLYVRNVALHCWADARVKIARMTLTIKLDRNWNSFQRANSAPPTSATDRDIVPSARMLCHIAFRQCRCCRGRGACFHDMLCATSCVCMRLAGGCVWLRACRHVLRFLVWARGPLNNSGSHIDASHPWQHVAKGERLARYEVNAVMSSCASHFLCQVGCAHDMCLPQQLGPRFAILMFPPNGD